MTSYVIGIHEATKRLVMSKFLPPDIMTSYLLLYLKPWVKYCHTPLSRFRPTQSLDKLQPPCDMPAVFMELISRIAINENNKNTKYNGCKQSRIAPGYSTCRDWLTVAHGDLNPNDPGTRANHQSRGAYPGAIRL